MRILRSIRLLGVVLRAIGHTLTLPKIPEKHQASTMLVGKELFRCATCNSTCTRDATGKIEMITRAECPIFVAWRELGRSK